MVRYAQNTGKTRCSTLGKILPKGRRRRRGIVNKTETRVSVRRTPAQRVFGLPGLTACTFPPIAQRVFCRCSPGSGGAAVTPAIRGSPLPDLGGEKVSDQLRQRAILRHGHQFQIAAERLRETDVKTLGLLCFLAAAWSGVCLLWGSARANGGRRSWWRRGLLRSWCRCRCGDLRTFHGCQATHPTGGVCRLLPVVGVVWREGHCSTWAGPGRRDASGGAGILGISAVYDVGLIVSDSADCRDGKPGSYRDSWASCSVRQQISA